MDLTCKYCPKCGNDLLKDNPHPDPFDYESKVATKYFYCKKCDCQVLYQEEVNFCTVCGKKIEKTGYLCYEGFAVDNLINEWPISKKHCKDCFSSGLEELYKWYDDDTEEGTEYIGHGVGIVVGILLGIYYDSFILGIIFVALGYLFAPITLYFIFRYIKGPSYKEVSPDKSDSSKKKYEKIEKGYSSNSTSSYERKGSIISAILWMTILSIFLGWIPILGSLIAGYVGGKKSRKCFERYNCSSFACFAFSNINLHSILKSSYCWRIDSWSSIHYCHCL